MTALRANAYFRIDRSSRHDRESQSPPRPTTANSRAGGELSRDRTLTSLGRSQRRCARPYEPRPEPVVGNSEVKKLEDRVRELERMLGRAGTHLLSKLYERTSVIITTNLSFSEWASVFGDAKMSWCRFP